LIVIIIWVSIKAGVKGFVCEEKVRLDRQGIQSCRFFCYNL